MALDRGGSSLFLFWGDFPAVRRQARASMARTTDLKAGRALQRVTRPAPVRQGAALWERITQYVREVVAELRRVDWPSRRELSASTLIVIVVLLVLALYLGVWDFLFTLGAKQWLTGP